MVDAAPPPPPQARPAQARPPQVRPAPRAVAAWLYLCAAMVFAMVLIGGVTRLTESGLSIVEWQPLVGAIPPLGEADWQALFQKYQASPQFQQVNRGMDLAEFKTIFWWEYVHRLWGRLIGAVFLLPFLWFLLRRQVRGPLAWKLAGIFALGGLQGAMGWYMVASGLVDRPDVSQYRLAAHLGLALLIYALLLWQAMHLSRASSGAIVESRLRRAATALLVLITMTILAGAFVAGLDAGLIYNTFPLMEGRIVPPDYGAMQPWWRDWFDNRATVQFHHRVLAIATLGAVLAYVPWLLRKGAGSKEVVLRQAQDEERKKALILSLSKDVSARRAAIALLHLAVLQVALGIATLLLVVPVPLAALHQAGAMALLTAALWLRFTLR
ncbi:MAG: COX15/CtaA family protein [Alphaproteobacteria bacterium]|nr:COX15/CtaA family protein [Alphaproteobacteria bacterium]